MNFELSIFNFQFSIIDIIGAVIGLFYIISEYRAGRWFWPLSLLMSAFYIYIDFKAGYYANGSICIYNFIISLYGLLVWRGILHSKEKKERPFGSCRFRYVRWILSVLILIWVALWWLLDLLEESQYPALDGFSSALTIIGMWMLSMKWWQQWFCWMFVEPVMMVLFWLSGNYASALLYVVFEVFCILGVIKWRKEYLKYEKSNHTV